ncbi:MAG: hypothetical protein NC093_08345 [Alistipes sp.]|nr:hypothetical protein [Alistipes sp.]
MLNFGYIRLGRNFMDWRWYSDGNTVRLFLHLLMSCNFEEREFQDITVRRGQRLASLTKLADELNLTVRQIRTAFEHLEKTGDVTRSSSGKFTIVTVNSYDDFILPTNRCQDDDKETTGQRQANDNNEINIINNNNYKKDEKGAPASPVQAEKSSPSPEADKTAQDRLISDYGRENVLDYQKRVQDWMAAKGISHIADFWGTVARWMKQDNVAKPKLSDGFDPEKYKFLINNF